MKKKFITSLALLILLNLLIKPFYIFIIEPKVQNTLGNIDYGFYFSLFGFSFILNIILDLGITNYNNRNIARYPQLINRLFGKIIAIKLMLGMLYCILILLAGIIAGYRHDQFKLLGILVVNQFLTSFILYFRSNITALHLFKTDSIVSVLDKVISIILIGTMLWNKRFAGNFTIYHFVLAQTLSYSLTFLVAFLIVYGQINTFSLKFDRKYLYIIIKKSLPFALLIFFMASYKWFDSFIIERILPNHTGKEQAGIYAQSFRLLDGISQYSYLFSIILLPMFASMIKKKEPVNGLVKLSTLLLMVPVSIFAISTLFYRHEIIVMFYHRDESSSSLILGILMINLVFISLSYIFGTLLTANGSMKTLNILAGTALIVNVGLNLILIPKYKALGCAIAGTITQMFMAISQAFIAREKFSIYLKRIVLVKVLAFLILIVGIAIWSNYWPTKWYINYIIVIASGFALSLFSGLIQIKNFREILVQ